MRSITYLLTAVVVAITALSAPMVYAKSAPWVLSAKGYGPLHTGMSKGQVKHKVGKIIEDSPEVAGCEVITVASNPHIHIMFFDQKLARIEISDPTIKTDRGIGVGATEDEVKAAYDPLLIEPHQYDDSPAHYLFFWETLEKQGIKFETGQDQIVGAIYVGNEAIRFVEGCV